MDQQEQLDRIDANLAQLLEKIEARFNEETKAIREMAEAARESVTLLSTEKQDFSYPVKIDFAGRVAQLVNSRDTQAPDLMQEISRWLSRQGLQKGRDYLVNLGSTTWYLFRDPKDAMLFKLAWS